MSFLLHPWHLLLIAVSGWINREQQSALEFQHAEIRVLLELLGKKRLVLNDDQRRRLAVKGSVLGRKRLAELVTIFTPDTILRWHRKLVAEKWDYTDQRKPSPGRPPVTDEIKRLVLQFAQENPSWGYDRIAGSLANLGHTISDASVGNILKENGVEPAPERKAKTTWKTFVQAHWDVLGSIDFTTIEVWTRGGLVTFYLLFAMKPCTRRVEFVGCTTSPDDAWMKNMAKGLTCFDDSFFRGTRYVLMDRDTKFSEGFREILKLEGIEPVRLPPRSPNLNAHLERFMRSIKDECLDRMIFFGDKSLRNAVRQYLEHYHTERNHQGIANKIIDPEPDGGQIAGTIECRERLGGMLRYYHRQAAGLSVTTFCSFLREFSPV